MILILEAAVIADILLNRSWEEVIMFLVIRIILRKFYFVIFSHIFICFLNFQDFPEDPTGKFDELKTFVRSNAEMCEWVSISVVAAQVSGTM
jgi:hypothetical protein